MFEIGKEYSILYGSIDEPMHTTIKVLAIHDNWIEVESEKVDPLINLRSPLIHSASPFDRAKIQQSHDRLMGKLGTPKSQGTMEITPSPFGDD